MEKWKNIKDYQGYQVSNIGRVRTFNKVSKTKYHGIRRWGNRVLKFKGNDYRTGYRVTLWKDGIGKDFLVARLVAFTFFNEDINNRKLTVNHIDGNRFNNNIKNLELISLKDNINHAFENNLIDTSKRIILIDKETRKAKEFRSMAKASQFLNRSDGYISCLLKRGQRETDKYEIRRKK